MALGGIVAVAGCASGGSTAAVPPKTANATNRVLSTATLTINPTLLKHASSGRRSPAFVDVTGSGALSLQIITSHFDFSTDSLFTPPTVTVPLSSASPAPLTVPVPLYGPNGGILVNELLTLGSAATTIASTGELSYDFPVFPSAGTLTLDSTNVFGNVNNTTGLTLNAVVGGVVLSDRPDGLGVNTHFFSNGSGATFNATGQFVYAFPADANGGFTDVTVAGGFPKAVQLQSSGVLKATNVPGAFAICNNAPLNFGTSSGVVTLSATDGLNQANVGTVHPLISVSAVASGYLGSC
jgi:hypothetical protein